MKILSLVMLSLIFAYCLLIGYCQGTSLFVSSIVAIPPVIAGALGIWSGEMTYRRAIAKSSYSNTEERKS